jgi:predicted glycosyltransferase involved in capsule biosynthesis
MKLSLIVTYRQRENHLRTLLSWWKQQSTLDQLNECTMILVEADKSPSAWIEPEIQDTNIQYAYCPCAEVFHKTKALNLGLTLSQTEFVAPFDVDLIPIGDTLNRHLQMAILAPQILVTGYRVMVEQETVNIDELDAILEQTFIAPEDKPTALWKHLIRGERFGVVPFFNKARLLDIGGWDEVFVGWGGEDQDIMERYLQGRQYMCRSPELVYLHLAHEPNPQWHETSLVEENRKHYYAKRQADSDKK